jgi:hypothetical protein
MTSRLTCEAREGTCWRRLGVLRTVVQALLAASESGQALVEAEGLLCGALATADRLAGSTGAPAATVEGGGDDGLSKDDEGEELDTGAAALAPSGARRSCKEGLLLHAGRFASLGTCGLLAARRRAASGS